MAWEPMIELAPLLDAARAGLPLVYTIAAVLFMLGLLVTAYSRRF